MCLFVLHCQVSLRAPRAKCLLGTRVCAGKTTINSMYGTRIAVLAGDFLFAQSSWGLANLDNLEVGGCSGRVSRLNL